MYNTILLVAFLMIFMLMFGLADLAAWLLMKYKTRKDTGRMYKGKL